jgi:hypothetical protein
MDDLKRPPEPGQMTGTSSVASSASPTSLPAYEPPRLTVMSEDEVLSAFQVPVVAGSWWG